jgi:hypothetical protein
MRTLACLLTLALLPAAALGSPSSAAPSRLIVPGERLGPVGPHASLDDLRLALGRSNAVPEKVLDQDGSRVPGAVLYPGDPRRRIEIAWSDTSGHRRPAWARVRGRATAWRTPAGIRVGTSLLELEKLNGRAFTIWGFGSERAGRIRSWKGGALDDEMSEDAWVSLRLPTRATSREIAAVSQGGVFPSGDPSLRRLNPRVGEIVIRFDNDK